MAPTASRFASSYNSFSGVDIKGVFGNIIIAELQAISYSITREKAPIFTMGGVNARSFSRGKRGIAGTLVFIVFDRTVMVNAMRGLLFQSNTDEIRPAFAAPGSGDFASLSQSQSGVTPSTPVQGQETPISNVLQDQALAMPWYADQILPFDVTLAAANEYGALAVMKILGVELLNEGYGVSIDDIVSEQQHTYVAREIIGWTPVPNPNQTILAGQESVS